MVAQRARLEAVQGQEHFEQHVHAIRLALDALQHHLEPHEGLQLLSGEEAAHEELKDRSPCIAAGPGARSRVERRTSRASFTRPAIDR